MAKRGPREEMAPSALGEAITKAGEIANGKVVEVVVTDLDDLVSDSTTGTQTEGPVNEFMDVENEAADDFGTITVIGYTTRQNVELIMKAAAHRFWHPLTQQNGCFDDPPSCGCPFL